MGLQPFVGKLSKTTIMTAKQAIRKVEVLQYPLGRCGAGISRLSENTVVF
jgi:hypothetical protein